jgi:hypothetical protein
MIDFFAGLTSWGKLAPGISNQSSPSISSFLRKNGHNFVNMATESSASATEIGTGEDLIIAAVTSEAGRALRFRVDVAGDDAPIGVENNLSNKFMRIEHQAEMSR